MMQDENDMTDWLPGQPPPWLDAFGSQPLMVDAGHKGGELVPADPGSLPPIIPTPPPSPAPAPPPPAGKSTLGPRGRNDLSAALPAARDEIATPALPAPDAAQASPADLQHQAQVAGGPQPFTPPWLQAAEPPKPDAISGAVAPTATGGETPDASLARIAMDPNAQLADRQKAWQDLAPEQRTQLANNADPTQLAAIATADMDPKDLAAIAVRHQQAQLHLQSAQQLALAQKADEDARRNYQAYQAATQQANAATAQLSADAQKLSQEKIDPNEHGVGHFIASVLTAALGGAVSQYTGGRNLALEELDKQTQRRIDAQQTNIQNGYQAIGLKRNLIAEQLQRSGDLYHAQETYRISQYDRAASELQTRMQDYDPQGTTALRAAGVVRQIQDARDASLAAYNQQKFKNDLDLAKAQNESLTQQETVRHNKAGESLDYAKLGLEKQKTAADLEVFSPEQLGQLYPGSPVPPIPMSTKQYGTWLENSNKGQAATKAIRENAASDVATAIHNPVTGKPLEVGGQIVRAASPDIADKVNTQSQYAQAFLDTASAARRELAENPSAFNKEKYARIRSNLQDALKDFALANGLKYSSREAEALQDVLGTDFGDFKDRLWSTGKSVASLDTIIANVHRDNLTGLKAKYGYDGADPLLDTANPPASAPTPVDELLKSVASPNAGGSPEDLTAMNDEIEKVGKDTPEGKRARALTIAPSKLAILDDLAQQAQDGNKDALAALQTIAEGKTPGTYKELRRYAQQLVGTALSTDVLPATEETR